MRPTHPPTEDELHAYVDGQLSAQRQAEVAAYLAGAPAQAAQVARWQRDAQALRAALVMDAAPTLPARFAPTTVRSGMRRRRRRMLALCASWLLVLGVGAIAGWQAQRIRYDRAHPPMADALVAYRIFASDRARPVEMDASDGSRLQQWVSARLGRPLSLPDMGSYGYRLLGGRMLATAEGAAALLMYQDAQGQRISLYVRPSTRFEAGFRGDRQHDGLAASYWYRNGYGFAVVGRAGDPGTRAVQQAMPAAI